jgi:hypothetical protein
METIKVTVDWCEKNYSALIGENIGGVIVVTDKTLDGLKDKLREGVQFHIEGLGDEATDWMKSGEYTFQYEYTISAILQNALNYTTLAALSRITGIRHAQLSHYANALSRPKQPQSEKIISGLHTIGKTCLSYEV